MSNTKNIQTELGRDLGFITAFSIGVGTMIAAGIFTLSGLAIRNVGSGAIISFGLAVEPQCVNAGHSQITSTQIA